MQETTFIKLYFLFKQNQHNYDELLHIILYKYVLNIVIRTSCNYNYVSKL